MQSVAPVEDFATPKQNATSALSSALLLRATIGLQDTFSTLSHSTHLQSIDRWIGFETANEKLWCRIVSHDGVLAHAMADENPIAILRQITQLEPIIVKLEGLLGQPLIPSIVQAPPLNCVCLRITENECVVDIQLPLAMVMTFEMIDDVRSSFEALSGEIQFDAYVLAPALSADDIENLAAGDMILWPESASDRPVMCKIDDSNGAIKWQMNAQLPSLLPTKASNTTALNWSICWKNVTAPSATISGRGEKFQLPIDQPAVYYRDDMAFASVYLVPFGNGFSLLVDHTYI
jgi:hypothetical protein